MWTVCFSVMSFSRSKPCFSGAVTFLGDRGGFCEKSHIFCKQLQPTFQGWWRTFYLCHTVTWNLSDQQERAWSELLLYMPQSGWRLKVYLSIPLGLDPLGLAAFGSPSLLFLSPSPREEMLPFSRFLGQSFQQTIFVLFYGTVRSLMLLLHHISSLAILLGTAVWLHARISFNSCNTLNAMQHQARGQIWL